MEKMRIKTIGACLIVSFLAVLLLSDTVSAEAVIGPPIGEQEVEFSPTVPLPNQPVTVTISWWITETDEPCASYKGPFNLHIYLKDSDGNKVPNWAIDNTTGTFGYPATETNPYSYEFTENAPSEIGEYSFGVQIVATGLEGPAGKSGNSHPLLVASEGGTVPTVPEFSTIAIPVAAILGLLFFFNHRKRRKAE